MICVWSLLGFCLRREFLFVALILLLRSDECTSVNDEGLALLKFRSEVVVDPHGAFKNWDHTDRDPCSWKGVRCIDGKVETLNLKELSLGGMLAPELGKLSHLRSLVLYKNEFSGSIPKEIGQLTMLEVLDLRGNNLSGIIPTEIGEMISLRHLLLCDDNFQSSSPSKLNRFSELECDKDLSFNRAMDTDCMNRKFKYCIQQNSLQQLKKANSFVVPIKGEVLHFLVKLSWLRFKRFLLPHGSGQNHGVNIQSFPEPYIEQHVQLDMNSARRKLLQESSNLPAVPVSGSPSQEAVTVPSTGSGAFPAVPNPNGGKSPVPPPNDPTSGSATSPVDPDSSNLTTSEDNETSIGLVQIIVLALPAIAIIIMLIAGTILRLRQKGAAVVDDDACKTGLSGPLQKAFVAGVPKLNRTELEAACEDFSNIIVSYPFCTIYKGTLSSGVEIAVISTVVASNNWSKRSEAHFRKKVDILSRVNHKNFVNLLGYCKENEPFMRMVALEYAPNGTLYEHLHLKEFEHLDWTARMRIIMGTAYCLQYLHHELNPPVALTDLKSKSIYLTDDYAAKICDRHMWEEIAERQSKYPDEETEDSESLSVVDPGTNVYSFGIIMLETISGKVPHSEEEEGSILNWATEYLNDKRNFKNLVDPSLKTCKNNELEVVCEAIRECILGDLKNRPSIMELTAKLKAATGISPEAATPRGSPLWWAELEILSVEAS